MPSGPLHTYEQFYACQKKFCDSSDFSNWTVYLLVDGQAEGQQQEHFTGKKTRVLCGSICLLDIQLGYRRCEVGSIWFHPAVHGTFVMLETTYALLRFAFERLRSGRVQWKTHHGNIASQKAAIKLGFDMEGVLRKHIICWDGTWRHSYYYSMTDDDWLGVPVTTDGRPGLEVGPSADRPEDAEVESKGRQLALEGKIAERRKSGKPIPASILAGQPLEQ
jgi:RimJ/RimL family protein N-acetyltransferase